MRRCCHRSGTWEPGDKVQARCRHRGRWVGQRVGLGGRQGLGRAGIRGAEHPAGVGAPSGAPSGGDLDCPPPPEDAANALPLPLGCPACPASRSRARDGGQGCRPGGLCQGTEQPRALPTPVPSQKSGQARGLHPPAPKSTPPSPATPGCAGTHQEAVLIGSL